MALMQTVGDLDVDETDLVSKPGTVDRQPK